MKPGLVIMAIAVMLFASLLSTRAYAQEKKKKSATTTSSTQTKGSTPVPHDVHKNMKQKPAIAPGKKGK